MNWFNLIFTIITYLFTAIVIIMIIVLTIKIIKMCLKDDEDEKPKRGNSPFDKKHKNE